MLKLSLQASSKGNLEITKILIAKGTKVNIKNNDNILCAPLFIASAKDYLEVAKLLLQNGADIECRGYKCRDASSALYQAAKRGHFEMAKLLLEHNASLTYKCKNGLTPYEIARQNQHKKITRLLYENMTEDFSLKALV